MCTILPRAVPIWGEWLVPGWGRGLKAENGRGGYTYLGVGRGTGFAETVALLDGDFESLVKCVDDLSGQRCGARVHHSQTAEVVFVDDGVFAEEQDDGWDEVSEGDLLVLHDGAELFDVELGHYYCRQTAVEGLVDETCEAWTLVLVFLPPFARGIWSAP